MIQNEFELCFQKKEIRELNIGNIIAELRAMPEEKEWFEFK